MVEKTEKQQGKINEIRSLLFENAKKFIHVLQDLLGKKREDTNHQYQEQAASQQILQTLRVTEYYEQFYTDKFDNLDKMYKFFKDKDKLLNLKK